MAAIFASIIFLVGTIILGVVLVLVRLLTRKESSPPLEDETLAVQEMYRTLDRLEQRVDVLETLLAERCEPRSTTTSGQPD